MWPLRSFYRIKETSATLRDRDTKKAILQLAGALMGLLPKLEFAVSENSAGPSVGFVCNPNLCEDVK